LALRLLEELNRETLGAARPGTAATERAAATAEYSKYAEADMEKLSIFFSEYSAYFAVAVATSFKLNDAERGAGKRP